MVAIRPYFDQFFSWLDAKLAFPEKPEPKPSFTDAMKEIVDFNNYIKNQTCPNCEKTNTFKVIDYERGNNGFEAKVICIHCQTRGTVNPTGFQYVVSRVKGVS